MKTFYFTKISILNSCTKLFSIFIFLSLFSSCMGPRTEEDLAEEVIQAFKDDDQRAFKNLFVKQVDIENIIAESSIPEDMKRNARQDLRAKSAFFKTISKLHFRSTRYKAFENGVNWQDVEIVNINKNATDYSFFNFSSAFMEKYGIEVTDIDIEFLSNGDTFNLHLDDCIKSNTRGWCLTENVRIRRKNIY